MSGLCSSLLHIPIFASEACHPAYLEVGRSCPVILSIDTKNGSAVDVAGADEAMEVD